MILYDEKTNAFLLGGKNYSYAMYVNDAGFLQNLHYGGKITPEDLPFLISAFGESKAPKKENINMDMSVDGMPGECGFFGHGDYREPTVLIRRADGGRMSRFRYVSYSLADGAPDLAGMPHARGGGQTLSVLLKDDFSETEILLRYTVWEDGDVLVRNAEIRNAGREAETLAKAFSFCLDLPCGEYDSLRLGGRWAQERMPERAPIAHGITRLQSLRGCSSHQTNPFLGVLKRDCGEETGECYGFALVYSGSFALTAEARADGPMRIQGGVCDVNFEWQLKGGETFVTPQAMLCYSPSGLGGMSRGFADFIRAHIVDPRRAFAKRPIVVNNWEATYFAFDEKKLFSLIDEAAKLGIDTFVLDDGWFGKRDDDRSGLGDWFVNENKLKGGLKPLIDRCRERGMKFGLWFEPEMISEDSDLFRAHPDWAIGKDGVAPARGRNQLVLDFTRKEIVDYVFSVVAKVLRENDISYVKWDMNRSITEVYSRALPAERQGEFMHRYILGVYDLAGRLTGAFPDVFFEGCAGGGGRFDAGMLYYFPQIWTSDDTDAYERTKIQWGTSVCYPVSAMSCHVSACPNHQTGRTTPFSTRGAVASLGATGYELDISAISEEEKEQIKEQVAAYKRIEDLVLCGDLYRLLNPFEENYFCEMLVSKDRKRAYVVGQRFRRLPCDYDISLRLRGLDEEKVYRIEELGVSASGKALMGAGLLLPGLNDYGSWIWHIEAEEK